MAERQELPAGTVFDGRYTLLQRLGGGGMGHVYLAEEARLERRCALKVLHPEMAKDRDHVERFLREAQLIARLSHPNIVQIYAFGEAEAGVYFAMELLAGEDLHARVKARRERPYTVMEAVAWAVEIARAVGVVHAAGLIHRDLKASNVFLAWQDGQDLVKLLDFGIARPVVGSDLTKTGVSLGTPSYMSPEQILNSPLDARTDIYSFGVVLFKLLTGRTPFIGSHLELAMMHCSVAPSTPSAVAPDAGIPPSLDALVLRMLAKSPGERPASMQEVEQALLAILADHQPTIALMVKRRTEGVPLQATASAFFAGALPVPATPPPARSSRRWLVVVMAALSLALVGVLVVLLTGPARTPDVAAPPSASAEPRPLDAARLAREAQDCRRTQAGASPITVEAVVGVDGVVTRAVATTPGPLGECLARVVLATPFEPRPTARFTSLEL
jgi:serine/threonine protein kinase